MNHFLSTYEMHDGKRGSGRRRDPGSDHRQDAYSTPHFTDGEGLCSFVRLPSPSDTLIVCCMFDFSVSDVYKKEISESALPISPQSDVGSRPILVPYTLVLMYKISFQKIIGSFMLGILCRLVALYLHALAPASSPALGVPLSRKICRKLL